MEFSKINKIIRRKSSCNCIKSRFFGLYKA
nr:MAG TPA: hypothetical protein [Caudoviricetes sp.]